MSAVEHPLELLVSVSLRDALERVVERLGGSASVSLEFLQFFSSFCFAALERLAEIRNDGAENLFR